MTLPTRHGGCLEAGTAALAMFLALSLAVMVQVPRAGELPADEERQVVPSVRERLSRMQADELERRRGLEREGAAEIERLGGELEEETSASRRVALARRLAELHRSRGELREAFAALDRVYKDLHEDPAFPREWKRAYEDARLLEEARVDMERAVHGGLELPFGLHLDFLLDHGIWDVALEWVRRAGPPASCAYSAWSQKGRSFVDEAYCQAQLGRFADALDTLESHVSAEEDIYDSHLYGQLLVSLYELADAFDLLEQQLQSVLERQDPPGSAVASMECLQARRLEKAGDVEGLWNTLVAPSQRPGRRDMVFDMLLEFPTASAEIAWRNVDSEHRNWALAVVACLHDERVLPHLLDEIATTSVGADAASENQQYGWLSMLVLLGTEEAYGLLGKLAAGEEGHHTEVAERLLRKYLPGQQVRFSESLFWGLFARCNLGPPACWARDRWLHR